MGAEIIAISVRAPELGIASPPPGVQDIGRPRIHGWLAKDRCGKEVAYLILHPIVNFMHHYRVEPLQSLGGAVLAPNSRYANNDSALLVRSVIQDIGAGVKFLRKRGYERIIYIGNFGGGSVGTLYQATGREFRPENKGRRWAAQSA